jgi:PHD/YefM family antitoxin component YafN of YafNO toxin-antitoxin module
MKKVSVADMEARFSAFLKESQERPVVVMRDDKPVAVLMGVHDEDELERLVFAASHRLQEILEAGRKEIREGRGIPSEEFWKQVELPQPRNKKKQTQGKK